MSASEVGTIVAIAGDPGGANAVAPVLEKLVAAGRPVLALAYRQARDVWNCRGIPFDDFSGAIHPDQVQGLLHALDARRLLTATSANGQDLERCFVKAARAIGVPSLAVLDFWSNYRLRFGAERGDWSALPDQVAVMDEWARNEMIAEGFPPHAIKITGQPAFDELQALRRTHTPARTSDLRAQLSVGANEKLVLFASQPLAALSGTSPANRLYPGYTEHTVLAELVPALDRIAARRDTPLVLLVRPHPREDAADLQRYQGKHVRVVVSRDGNPRSIALAADLVTGMTTVLLVEACLMGCIVVSLQPGLRSADVLPTNRWEVSQGIYQQGEMEPILDNLLFDADAQHNARRRAHQCRVTPGAAQRVIDLLDSLTLRIANHGENRERISH